MPNNLLWRPSVNAKVTGMSEKEITLKLHCNINFNELTNALSSHKTTTKQKTAILNIDHMHGQS